MKKFLTRLFGGASSPEPSAREETATRPDPAEYKDRPIGDLLDALGVPEDTSRYEKGTTTLYFRLGDLRHPKRADPPDEE